MLKDVNEVLKSSIIDKWWKKKSKKNKGKGIKQQWTFIRNLLSVFNTCNVTPEMLVSRDTDYVEEIRDQYMAKYREGKEWRISKNSKHGNPDTKEYNINQALASLCAVYSISWERGTEDMPRVVQGHGKYKNVRFSKEEFRLADKYLIEKFGIDSDPYRWFWIGVETMSRAGALLVMKLHYDEVFNKDGSTKSLHMDTFESKLEHTKKGGDVEKFVRRENTIKSVKALRSRGCSTIYENKQGFSKGKLMDYFTQTMKDLYTHLGHDETEFFFIRPNHTLRHLGAQYWLLKSKFRDFGIVAEIGDWSNITELSDSYGGTPPEVFQETIDGYDYSD